LHNIALTTLISPFHVLDLDPSITNWTSADIICSNLLVGENRW